MILSIPFIGSKKYSYFQVRDFVKDRNYKDVYEPFGGSCLLSVNLLNDGFVSAAYVNDYDRFFDKYPTYLDLKDKVVDECFKAGFLRTSHDDRRGSYEYLPDGSIRPVKSKMLQGEKRKKLQEIIKENVPEEYWRYFTLGNNFCHSGFSHKKDIKLNNFAMFNAYVFTDKQRHYLEKLNLCEKSNLDYRDFLDKYEDQITSESIIIADPPYFETTQYQYGGTFDKADTEELIQRLNALPCDYIFFNRDVEQMQKWFPDAVIERTGTRTTANENHSKVEYIAYVEK